MCVCVCVCVCVCPSGGATSSAGARVNKPLFKVHWKQSALLTEKGARERERGAAIVINEKNKVKSYCNHNNKNSHNRFSEVNPR